MSLGMIAALVVAAGFAIWGATLIIGKIREKPTEASSHHESQTGFNGY